MCLVLVWCEVSELLVLLASRGGDVPVVDLLLSEAMDQNLGEGFQLLLLQSLVGRVRGCLHALEKPRVSTYRRSFAREEVGNVLGWGDKLRMQGVKAVRR